MSAASKILLGLGGTVDFEIRWDSAQVSALAKEFEISLSELGAQAPIDSERSLLVSMLSYLNESKGGERHVSSTDVIFDFSRHFDYETTLGGTGVRAGIALHEFGVSSLAHLVSIDDTVRRLLPQSVEWVCSATEDSLDPHFIIQYPAKATIELVDGSITTTQPNRLIYAHDVPNRDMILHPDTAHLIKNAELFLACGFNGIRSEDVLHDRLAYVTAALDERAENSFVFFEDAGYHIEEFANTVREQVCKRVDVYSMNEDEMQGLLGRKINLLNGAEVGQAIAEVHAQLGSRNTLVHSRYWAILVGEDAPDLQSGLDMGVLFAATRFRVGDAFSQEAVAETQTWPTTELSPEFHNSIAASVAQPVATTPGFVIDIEHPTTIGLGDTFAGGFIYAMYLQRLED